MKKIAVNTFNPKTKKDIISYTPQFIKYNFETPLLDAQLVLQNNIAFFNDQTFGEAILKQSFIKGTFPRMSFRRDLIEKEMKNLISEKLHIEAPTQKSDFRLIGEILADALAKTSNTIKKITMNFEDPQRIKVITNQGNVNKDVTVSLSMDNNFFSLERDIKAGNNANNPFSGVIACVPYTSNMQNYSIINDKPVSLDDIQIVRAEHFNNLKSTQKDSTLLHDISDHIQYLIELPIDKIKRNILIQEEIFKVISTGLNIGASSLYAAHVVVPNAVSLREAFFNKLEPHIDTHIFDNNTPFKQFLMRALVIYNETVNEIAKNVKQNKKLLKESGLDQIVDGIFN